MTIEAMEFHRYLVSLRQDGDPIEVVVELTPEAIADAAAYPDFADAVRADLAR